MSGRDEALARALLDFDSKRTDELERFAAAHPADASLVAELCDFAGSDDPNLQAGATWLLKRLGVTGAQLSSWPKRITAGAASAADQLAGAPACCCR